MKYKPYSNSKVSKAQCPFAFHKQYIEKVKGPRRENLMFGASVHEVMKDQLDSWVMGKDFDLVDSINANTPAALIERLGEVHHIMALFRDRFRFAIDMDHVVGIEEKIALDVVGRGVDWDSDEAFLRGILDVVEIKEKHCVITDHKTQFNILNDAAMDAHEQLTFYCLLAKKFYPQVETFTVRIYFARYGIMKSSQRTMEDVERIANVFESKIRAIDSIEEWVPIPGQTCAICDCLHLCPLAQYDPTNKDSTTIMGPEDAVRVAKLLRVREEQVRRAKESLQQYCSANGSVPTSGDWEYGYVHGESKVWPVERTMELFKKHGNNINPHVSLSTRSLKKFAERAERLDPDFAEDLYRAAKTVGRTSFKGFKP